MLKFGRNYKIEITDINGNLQTVRYPIQCDFDIDRNTLAQANSGEFTLFQLGENTRNLIRKSALNRVARYVKFYAGYGYGNDANLPLVFSGFLNTCFSYREGNTWITQVSAKDPGFSTVANVSISYGAGSSRESNAKNIVKDFMPGINFGQIGAIFDNDPTLLRGNSYSGPATSILKQMTNGNFFIDNSTAYILGTNEYLPANGFDTIDSANGLLGTPSYDGILVNARLVFEPRVVMAQLLTLNCESDWLNGQHKVSGIKHKGRISGSSSGDAESEISLYYPLDAEGLKVFSTGDE